MNITTILCSKNKKRVSRIIGCQAIKALRTIADAPIITKILNKADPTIVPAPRASFPGLKRAIKEQKVLVH